LTRHEFEMLHRVGEIHLIARNAGLLIAGGAGVVARDALHINLQSLKIIACNEQALVNRDNYPADQPGDLRDVLSVAVYAGCVVYRDECDLPLSPTIIFLDIAGLFRKYQGSGGSRVKAIESARDLSLREALMRAKIGTFCSTFAELGVFAAAAVALAAGLMTLR
jgi:hypothetical protein